MQATRLWGDSMPRYICFSLFLSQMIVHSMATAADITWVGGLVNLSGNWSNAENWDTGTVPGQGDRAFITFGGSFTVTLDVDAFIDGLAIGDPRQGTVSQTLLLSAGRTLTVTENFDWHGGTIKGPGALSNTGTMNITAGFVQTLNDGAFIDNAGTINITSTEFRAGGGAILNNLPGAFVILQDDADANASFQVAPALELINAGVVSKIDGAGTANWALGYSSQGGIVGVNQGVLVLGLGGNSIGGTIAVAPGATLDFSSPVPHNFTGNYDGLVSGNVVLDTSIDPKGASFNFEDFNWFGGFLTGPGTLKNDGVFNLNAGSIQTMNAGAVIDNAGIINITSTEFRGGGGAIINNLPGGSIFLQDGSDANASFQVAPALNLINQGLVAKPDGLGVGNWALTYSNEGGTIDVKQGTLDLGLGGRSLGGTIMVAPNATLDFSSPAQHIFSGAYDGIVDGNVILDTGIDPAGAGFFFQNFNWFGGTLTGPGTLKNNGVLNITSGSVQTMNNAAAIENVGTINISSTEFRGGGGAVITNRPNGIFLMQNGADANNSFQVAPSLVFINEGLVVKRQGPGTANWALLFNHQGGTIDVQAGTLKLALGGNSTGGALKVAAGTTLDFTSPGQHTFSGTYTGTVDGNVILDTAIDPAGASFDFQNFNWFGGLLTGPGTLRNDQTLNITAGSVQTMNDSAAIENLGTINISSTDFRGGGGAVITNRSTGSLGMEDGANARNAFQVAPPLVLINEGMVAKRQGAGTANWALLFNHQGGTIDVQAGTLKLALGGNSTGGALNVAAGTILDFTSPGQHTFSGTYLGAVDGNVILDTAIDPSGAIFSFQNFNWFGGLLTGPGTLRNDQNLNITAGSVQTMNNTASIENFGTINISSTDFRGGGGAVITNRSSGSLGMEDGANARNAFQVAPPLVLINEGMVAKRQGAGTANWALLFNHQGGAINVQAGTLKLSLGGSSTGGAINVEAGATLDFTSPGQHVFSDAYNGSVAGNAILDIGIDLAGANFNFQNFNWFGGSLRGPGTLVNSGNLNIIAGSVQVITGSALIDNDGVINLTSTDFRGGDGSIINNRIGASFFIGTGAIARFAFDTSPELILNNAGTISKQDGPGTGTWALPFENSGIVEAKAGILNFSQGYIQNAGASILAGGDLMAPTIDVQGGTLSGAGTAFADVTMGDRLIPGTSPGILTIDGSYTQLPLGTLNIEIGGQIGGSELDQLNITGAATLSGTMNVSLINMFIPVEEQQFAIMTYGALAGGFDQINGLDLGGGLTLSPNFTVNTLFLEIGGAALTASPPSLDFGEVLVGSSSIQQVTFTNNGAGTVTVGSIGVTGANLENFIVDPTPFTLDPEESQTLDVDFTPSFAGNFSADLAITSETLTITVPMTGSGIEDATDRTALEDLYNSTDGPNWMNSTNWLSQAPVSSWFGVLVENDRVTALDLSSNNLVGTLPGTIGNLTDLVEIFLQSNKLSGPIPATIGNLINLVGLSLAANQLSGPMPVEIGNLQNIDRLFLDTNQLNGPIPPQIGNLSNLSILALNNNQLDGTIPVAIGNLINLGRLQLEANQLLGAIPLEIGNLINLIDLRLDVNQLTGAIPTEIGNLTNLQNLELADNRLSGAVPLEVTNLASLGVLFLNDNLLVDLPDLSGLRTLNELHVQNNLFTFEDIEPNLGFANFTYTPQDSVETAEQRTILVGSALTLSVTVGGENNLYQWSKDAVDIVGATATTLTLDPVDFSNTADYGCRITNSLATNLILQRRPITVVVSAPEPVRVDIPSPPTAGSEQTLTISSPADFQPTINQMFYRMAGQEDFEVTSLAQSGSDFEGTIPSDFVTIRGVEYYISLSDGQIAVTFPETDPINEPAILPVQISRLEYPIPLQPETFKMISLPVALTSTQIDSVLMDDYGEYDVLPRQWRVFRLQNGAYVEHPNIPPQFENGAAFWLITREGLPFDLDNGESVNSADSVVITLAPGFNQIGNPFAFPVAWNDVMASGNVQAPIPFDGVEYLLPGPTLEPFEGYFVFNAESTPVTLKVPPTESSEESGRSLSKPRIWQAGDYVLRLMATVPGTTLRDSQNYLGFRAGATDFLDELDLLTPPPIEDHLQLNIVEAGYSLTTNFKTENDFGQEWFLEITTTLARKSIAVRFEESGDRPEGFELFVFDQNLRSIIPVQDGSFTLRPEENMEVRHLRVLIGTANFAEQNAAGIPLAPIEFALEQNFPNPFNPETTIEYRLAKAGEVRLEIFNLLGQKIHTLVNEEQPAGVYSVQWNGLDDLGRHVASGVYVYRLRSEGRTATKKLLLLQ